MTTAGSTQTETVGLTKENNGIEVTVEDNLYTDNDYQYFFHQGFNKGKNQTSFFDNQMGGLPIDNLNGGVDTARGMQIRSKRWITFNIPMLDTLSRDNAMLKNAVNYLSSKPLINGVDINVLNNGLTSEELFTTYKEYKSYYAPKKMVLTKGWFFGGSAGLMWFKGQESASALRKPLLLDKVEKDSFMGIKYLSRWFNIEPALDKGLIQQIGEGTGFDDARYIGLPLYYNVNLSGGLQGDANNKNFLVHASRLLIFHTEMPSYIETQVERFWGASLIEVAWNQLKNDERLWSATIKSGERNNMMVLKVKGLAMSGNISNHAKQNFGKRMQFMSEASGKSVMPIDADDDISFIDANLNGQSGILELNASRVAGALKVPVSVLFPNIQADKEDNSYIQSLATLQDIQESTLREWDERLIPIIIKSKFGKEVKDIIFNYNPIETLTTKEKAEIANINSQTIATLFENDVIDSASAIKMVDDISKDPVNLSQHITTEYRNDIIQKAKKGEFVTKSSIQIEVSKVLNQQKQTNGDGKGIAGSHNPSSDINGKNMGGKQKKTDKNPIDLQK